MELTPKEHKNFWAKVDKSGGCWTWAGNRQRNGYGRLYFRGKDAMAHRLSYRLEHGDIPEGLVIDHICHVRECVNPAHLRAVTHKQNSEHQAGASKNSGTGVLGVYWDKSAHKYRAQVRHGAARVHVGFFGSLDAAREAVTAKRNELYTHNDLDRSMTA